MSNRLLQRKVSDSQLETVILSIDNLPLISSVTENSTAPITSGAVFSALALKQNTLTAGEGINISGTTISNSGVRSVTTGTTNGTISINTDGTSADVAVKGLGSNAYTSTTYAPAATTLTKLTYQYQSELACNSNGKVCLGKFTVYDSNITISISSTTNTTYNGILVIATQNYLIQKISLYGNENNALNNLIKIVPSNITSGDANYHILEVYASLAGYSKNIIKIDCIGLKANPTDILTSIANIPTTATAKPVYLFSSILSGKQDTLVSGTNIKTIGGVSVLGSGNIPMPTSGYKQTFNVNGSEWGVCYKGLNETLKEDDMGKPANTHVGQTMAIFKSWQLNGVDVAYPYQITGANSYSARFESFAFADLSWDDIIALAKIKAFDSTFLGKTKQLDIGGVAYTVQIIGVNHDDLTDGTGKANLTFELKYLLAGSYAMNDTNTNSGGWEATKMRTNVLPNILSQMPTNIQKAIKSVNKANCKVHDSATITYTSDKLFLLSEAEVFGVKKYAAALEGTQYEYWANNNTNTARKKYQGEGGTTVNIWWLRSPSLSYSSYFCDVYASGSVHSIDASATYGVSFAFDL